MPARIRRSDDELPLSPPVLYVLLAVADGDRHGYAIMQEVEERTGGKVRLLPGSLYSTIKRMLAAGLVVESTAAKPDDDDPRRRYYGITERGREIAAAELERMAALIDLGEAKALLERS